MNNNGAVNGHTNGPSIVPLEIDEEKDSLLYEAAGTGTTHTSKLTQRKKNRDENGTDAAAGQMPTNLRGLLRARTALPERRAIIMGVLGVLALLFVANSLFSANYIERHKMEHEDKRIHQSSFGHEVDLHNLVIPESNVGEGVKSFTQENDQNEIGNYWHNPDQSPFASSLYDRSKDSLDAEQQEFEDKMKRIKKQWGSWDLVDLYYDNHNERQKPDFSSAKNRDLPLSEFPPDAWQMDEEYVEKFLDQARALIHRVKEGIYAEYGYPTVLSPEGKNLSNDELQKRNELFQVILDEYNVTDGAAVDKTSGTKKPGIAYLGLDAWDGLVRKLLHSLITNDRFYVVLAGRKIASAVGNNFMQSSVMSFHYLMEPVFDFLGMTLVSRNMANRYGSTTLSALGGADIYGEADIMWYLPDGHEMAGQLDLFQKQAVLSGERVPVLLTSNPGTIANDSNGTAWLAFLQPGAGMCEMTTAKNSKTLPPACQYVLCEDDKQFSCSWFDSVCWIPRDDVKPPMAQRAQGVPKPRFFPGFRNHQLEGRKLSLLLLHALEEAFERWEAGVEEDGFPLATGYWHVGEAYDTIRRNVRTHVAKENETVAECDKLFFDFPNVCHVEMHAFTEWTPRVNPDESSLSKVLDPKMDYLNFEVEPLYTGIDLLPLQWKIPSDQVDVHAIAISTSVPVESGDDELAWLNDEDDIVYNMIEGNDNDGEAHDDNGSTIAANETGEQPITAPTNPPPTNPPPTNPPPTNPPPTNPSPTKTKPSPTNPPPTNPSPTNPPPTNPPPTNPSPTNPPPTNPPPTKTKPSPTNPPPTNPSPTNIPPTNPQPSKPPPTNPPPTNPPPTNPPPTMPPPTNPPPTLPPPTLPPPTMPPPTMPQATQPPKPTSAPPVGRARRRTKTDFYVMPGKGWSVYNKVPGFCDGSAQSTCDRSDENDCLLGNQNDHRSGLLGDAFSGWLTLRIPHVKEGIILVVLDFSVSPGSNPATEGWNDEQGFNNRRELDVPNNFSLDFAVNGNVTSLSPDELNNVANRAVAGMTLLPLLYDNTMSQQKRNEDDKGETVDVAIRIRSPAGRNTTLMLTHVYYA